MNEYLLKDYIINASDILYLSKTKTVKNMLKKLSKSSIEIKNSKVHKQNEISHLENFIFNLDQYIYYIKKHIFIDPLEIRFLIELSLDTNKNKYLLKKKYYLENEEKYKKLFEEIFNSNFLKNQKAIASKTKNVNLVNSFNEICKLINNNKNNYYFLFESITNNNISKFIKIWTNLNY